MNRLNKSPRPLVLGLLLILMTVYGVASSQTFGKNKVQYKDFSWKYLQSKHFDVFYSGDGKPLADFTADVAESTYVSIKKNMRYDVQKRIPILIYNSHNDFEQTNITSMIIQEGILGFQEPFKNRMVVHFNGDYAAFRQLVHHELTHAVMFQMLYGGGMGSSITTMARFQLPTWVWEGMAEYESVGWDTEIDMYLRDATINGYVPPISSFYGGWNYIGGHALFRYIADKYGEQKVAEVLGKFRTSRGVENGLKNSIGLSMEDLTERWQKHLRKTYWPDIQDRDEPEDIGKKLTDHVKNKHAINNAPALSPKGDKIVYLSNRSDYIDIYLMSAIDGKNLGRLVKGERSELFEELHWPRPGIDWSPDGKRIAFAAKAGSHDAIYIMDVDKRHVEEYIKLPLDGVFSPVWASDGDRIAFVGLKGGQSDLYVYRLSDGHLEKLTDDLFSDLDPAWSPDGSEIAFISDRGENQTEPEGLRMQKVDVKQQDLYVIDVETKVITRYTDDEWQDQSPEFSPDGSQIAFVTDREGVNNIYMLTRDTGSSYPITNVLTGVSQISWSKEGSRLAFASFYNGGYDIYLMNNPLDIKTDALTIKKVAYLQKETSAVETSLALDPDVAESDKPTISYRNYVFGDDFRRGEGFTPESGKESFLEETEYKDSKGEYKQKKYKLRFTPDIISGGAGYSQFFGLQGSSMIALSDLLGNHQITLYADLFYSIKNSNFQVAYNFLPKRTDIGASIFHFSYLYYTYYTDGYYLYPAYLRDRNYGITFYASRPFSRFQRFDLGVTALAIDRDYGSIDPYYYYYYGYTGGDFMTDEGNLFKRRLLLLQLGYNTDTVLWGMTGPVNGGRSTVSFAYSPKISETYGLDYWTLRADWRKYMRIKRDYTFVTRLAGGVSGGQQPQRFLLGGMMGWINYRYNQFSSMNWGDDLFYFSSIETPFRGYPYYEMIGSRFFLANLEFRFPLVQYLLMGWPLPFGFQNVRGAIFMDIGSAWSDDGSWKPFASGESVGFFSLEDIKAGFGIGARMNLGFFLLKYDVAWPTNFDHTGKAVHYFTMGAEF